MSLSRPGSALEANCRSVLRHHERQMWRVAATRERTRSVQPPCEPCADWLHVPAGQVFRHCRWRNPYISRARSSRVSFSNATCSLGRINRNDPTRGGAVQMNSAPA